MKKYVCILCVFMVGCRCTFEPHVTATLLPTVSVTAGVVITPELSVPATQPAAKPGALK